jgi:hypothetical protein
VRGAWVRPDGPLVPDQRHARDLGCEYLAWDATDPALSKTLAEGNLLDVMRGAGWRVATTRSDAWPGTPNDGRLFGQLLAADLVRLSGPGKQHSTIADIERHDSAYVLAALKEFRSLCPSRYLFWTMEPLQFGPAWVTDALVSYIRSAPYTWVVPQLYRGESVPVERRPVSERACHAEIGARGLPPTKIMSYYARWEERWDGWLFDLVNVR